MSEIENDDYDPFSITHTLSHSQTSIHEESQTFFIEYSHSPSYWYRELTLRGTAAEASNHSPPFGAEVELYLRSPFIFKTFTVTNCSYFLILAGSNRTQNSAWLLNYAAGHCSIQWTIITWSSDSELLNRPTTTGPISLISVWRPKDPIFATLGFNTSKG
jgi:hypothetical protein